MKMKFDSVAATSDLGILIKSYREKSCLTQKELCDILGYSNPQFLSLIENGHSKLPLNMLSKLIEALNIPEKKIVDCLVISYQNEINQALQVDKRQKVSRK